MRRQIWVLRACTHSIWYYSGHTDGAEGRRINFVNRANNATEFASRELAEAKAETLMHGESFMAFISERVEV